MRITRLLALLLIAALAAGCSSFGDIAGDDLQGYHAAEKQRMTDQRAAYQQPIAEMQGLSCPDLQPALNGLAANAHRMTPSAYTAQVMQIMGACRFALYPQDRRIEPTRQGMSTARTVGAQFDDLFEKGLIGYGLSKLTDGPQSVDIRARGDVRYTSDINTFRDGDIQTHREDNSNREDNRQDNSDHSNRQRLDTRDQSKRTDYSQRSQHTAQPHVYGPRAQPEPPAEPLDPESPQE